MGLQNNRGVLLHEIGHAAMTRDRPQKLAQLKEEIKTLMTEKGAIPKEKSAQVKRLARKASVLENLCEIKKSISENIAIHISFAISGPTRTFPKMNPPKSWRYLVATVARGRE
ncbi:MAG: hypothetical protein Fur0032_20010 [Terrimicrobiaceae bacterium]